ncbi:hypothetical protein [Nocardioides coralli]|uniref:hypothetical protein n=1 Tax=Nocardioides coralli TaxID=2872154 RepID=UPI001CA3B486|nr:hypothetical protein [Nocardioides coralli]QZY28957.1 hypothetical protein K6T13_16200 [Nocardioides coralli]
MDLTAVPAGWELVVMLLTAVPLAALLVLVLFLVRLTALPRGGPIQEAELAKLLEQEEQERADADEGDAPV